MTYEPDNNTVGYKRPPKQHQFKKGKSGNPNGRPRKKNKPVEWSIERTKHWLYEAAGSKIRVNGGNRTQVMTLGQVTAMNLMKKAAGGDMSAAKFALGMLTDYKKTSREPSAARRASAPIQK